MWQACWQRGAPAEWKWSAAAAIGLFAWLAVAVGFASAVTLLEFWQEVGEEESTVAIHIGASLRYTVLLFAGICFFCYVRVSAAQPRSRNMHEHGFVLLIKLPELAGMMLVEAARRRELHAAAWSLSAFAFFAWGARRTIFLRLMVQKMRILQPPTTKAVSLSRCADTSAWGRGMVVSTILTSLVSALSMLWSMILYLRGTSYLDVIVARSGEYVGSVPLADRILLRCCLFLTAATGVVLVLSTSGFALLSWRLIHSTLAKMARRRVGSEAQQHLRRTLRHHLAGIWVFYLSNLLLLLAVVLDGLNVVSPIVEDVVVSVAHLADCSGDAIAVVLLSGIGAVLLRRGDAKAEDPGEQISSALYSAVLTSRVHSAFEGCVAVTPDKNCIVSFPGKFMEEWNALTWLCEYGQFSSACVFLPQSDPKARFGKHAPCPDTPGKCWCQSIYGETKIWGCEWFKAWSDNVKRAVGLRLNLVVVYFPGETGQGQVEWTALTSSDLWDGVGLGGSQKAEVAFLKQRGYSFVEEDLEATRRRLRAVH